MRPKTGWLSKGREFIKVYKKTAVNNCGGFLIDV